ncbi:BPK_collapsed_G0003750.mRNA.1.CDS.1 [Saccharomyces cerevisiae]|nr:BPK_collapsed_G0003750.mRNA.1.CDS.1 [Saccharomyces cerevisiae]
MCNRKPIFSVAIVDRSDFQIFRVLGTPNEAIWPDIVYLPDFKPSFPSMAQKRPITSGTKSRSTRIDLLDKLLGYDPINRISARRAAIHPYFQES